MTAAVTAPVPGPCTLRWLRGIPAPHQGQTRAAISDQSDQGLPSRKPHPQVPREGGGSRAGDSQVCHQSRLNPHHALVPSQEFNTEIFYRVVQFPFVLSPFFFLHSVLYSVYFVPHGGRGRNHKEMNQDFQHVKMQTLPSWGRYLLPNQSLNGAAEQHCCGAVCTLSTPSLPPRAQ